MINQLIKTTHQLCPLILASGFKMQNEGDKDATDIFVTSQKTQNKLLISSFYVKKNI